MRQCVRRSHEIVVAVIAHRQVLLKVVRELAAASFNVDQTTDEGDAALGQRPQIDVMSSTDSCYQRCEVVLGDPVCDRGEAPHRLTPPAKVAAAVASRKPSMAPDG